MSDDPGFKSNEYTGAEYVVAAERLDHGYDGTLIDVLPQAMMDTRQVAAAYLLQRDEIARLRAERAAIDEAASVVVRHTSHADCVGCGCMSLSTAERVASLAVENERLRAANAELIVLLQRADSLFNPGGKVTKMVPWGSWFSLVGKDIRSALARHDAEKGRVT